MERQKYCVYNQTRECFLSLGVTPADTPFARLKGLIGKLTLKSGEGAWIKPSSGIHTIGVRVPLDLIYLDDQLKVIHLVEHFPTFSIAPLRARSQSVLELAAHSIYSSQTQVGDQLLICVASEMERWLNNTTPRAIGRDSLEPKKKDMGSKMSWIDRLFSRDRRRAERHRPTPLLAFYWDGAEPMAHGIRDVSRTGIYLLTQHRWYQGTVVTMTLQRAQAVAGGFAFVLSPSRDSGRTEGFENQVDVKTLHRFIKRVQLDGEHNS
jgi:uncharacterized membrane protein (UPF0127 family)